MSATQPDDRARSAGQRDAELAYTELSDALLNIDHAAQRTKKALKAVEKLGTEPNVALALKAALTDLERTRKRLQRDAYDAPDALRLL